MSKQGKNSVIASTNLPKDTKLALAKLAETSGMTLSAYIAKVLIDAAESGSIYKMHIEHDASLRLAEDPAPYGDKPKKG